MKKALFCGLFFLLVMSLGAQETNPGLRTILNNWGERSYVPGAVSGADLDLILQAGLRAPSAGNRQPWHFTVVQDQALAGKIIPGVTGGNALVVISAAGDGKTNAREILDCALAAENIYLAAQALGYGSRLYTGQVEGINRSLKKDLGLPANHSAVIVVRIGKIQAGIDAVSRASPRKNAGDIITYK
jgi:nitroreductase